MLDGQTCAAGRLNSVPLWLFTLPTWAHSRPVNDSDDANVPAWVPEFDELRAVSWKPQATCVEGGPPVVTLKGSTPPGSYGNPLENLTATRPLRDGSAAVPV